MSSTPSTPRGSDSDFSSTFTSSTISTPPLSPASTTRSIPPLFPPRGLPGPYNNTMIYFPIHPRANPAYPFQLLPYHIHHILAPPPHPADLHPIPPLLGAHMRTHSPFHPQEILLDFLLWLHVFHHPPPVPLLHGTLVFTPLFRAHWLIRSYWIVPPRNRMRWWEIESVAYECLIDGVVDWKSYTNLEMVIDGIGCLLGGDGRSYIVDIDERALGLVEGRVEEVADRETEAGSESGSGDEDGFGDESDTRSWSSDAAVQNWNPARLEEENLANVADNSGAVDEQLPLKRTRAGGESGGASSAESLEGEVVARMRRMSI